MSYCRFDGRSHVYTYCDGSEWIIHVISPHSPRAPGLQCDGHEFHDDTPEGCRGTLVELREMGYHVPHSAVDRLNAEIENRDYADPEAEAWEMGYEAYPDKDSCPFIDPDLADAWREGFNDAVVVRTEQIEAKDHQY